jgi:hypothetical protein
MVVFIFFFLINTKPHAVKEIILTHTQAAAAAGNFADKQPLTNIATISRMSAWLTNETKKYPRAGFARAFGMSVLSQGGSSPDPPWLASLGPSYDRMLGKYSYGKPEPSLPN